MNDIFELFAVNCINQQVRTALKAFKATQDAKLGLLCFSERWKNPVLWSHYADSHRGICLGFDIHSSLHPTKVQYVTKKLRVDPDECGAPHGIAIPEEVQELLFVTKFTHWSYEEEVRAIVELRHAVKEGTRYFWPWSKHLQLKEVILGPLCSLPVEQVRKIVKAVVPDAQVGKARPGFKYFEVKIDGRYPLE